MKKSFWLLLLTAAASVIVVTAVLIRLFSAEEEPVQEVSPDTTLTFWRNSGNPAENAAFEQIVEAFEREYPDIAIDMNTIQYGDYEVKLRTEIATGSPPDILAIDSPNLALYARSELLTPLTDRMERDGVLQDISENVTAGLQYEGEIYLLPLVQSSTALFYNRTILEDAGLPLPSKDPDNPVTWQEIRDMASQVHDPSNGLYGLDPAQGFPGGEAPAYFKLPFLWQFGADVMSPDYATAAGYLNSDEAIEALTFYQSLYQGDPVASVELPVNAFENGQLAMTVMGSWELSRIEEMFPDFQLGVDFDLAPLPKGTNQVTPNGGWSLGISSGSSYPDEAWTFLSFVSSYEAMKIYVEKTGEIPARQSVAAAFPRFSDYPNNIFLTQTQSYSKSRPVTPVYPVVSEVIKTLFEEVGVGNEDPREAADRAVEKIEAALAQQNE